MTKLFLFNKKPFTRSGFTMIESLVGITVIILAITGPMYIAVRSTIYARYARDEVAAQYYAESLIEGLRADRDSMFIKCSNGNGWCESQWFIGTAAETVSETAWRSFKLNGKMAQYLDSTSPNNDYDVYVDNNVTYGELYTTNPLIIAAVPDIQLKFHIHTSAVSIPPSDGAVASFGSCSGGYSDVNSYDCHYNDDIRVQVDVGYLAQGSLRKVTVVDFLRPRI